MDGMVSHRMRTRNFTVMIISALGIANTECAVIRLLEANPVRLGCGR